MMKYIKIIFFAFSIIVLSSCEDKIDLDLDEGRSQLVVDGFLTNDSSIQTIRLTKSAGYFLNAATPSENDAVVRVIGPNSLTYNFISDGEGNFSYSPNTLGAIDSIGYDYRLEVEYDGELYISLSTLNPVPVIDSMTYDFEESGVGEEEGYYSQFYARDFAGRKDYYWIKAFKNGEPVYERLTDLILSEDAAFGGDGADGFVFILPIRAAITNEEEPFELGDTSSVELLSVNSAPFEYLEQILIQSGNDGLFSTPTANIRSNILDAAGNPQDEVLGVFSLSAVSKSKIIIQ